MIYTATITSASLRLRESRIIADLLLIRPHLRYHLEC